MRMDLNTLRKDAVARDVALASRVFGADHVWWPTSGDWVLIDNYQLPKRKYNRASTQLLLVVPPHYGFVSDVTFQEFYVEPGLKVLKNKEYVDIPHYYPGDGGLNKLFYRNWAWICLHAIPNTDDNILTFIKIVDLFLEKPFKRGL